MHDRQGEPGDRSESLAYDCDEETVSLPDDPCDVSCAATECCGDVEVCRPAERCGDVEVCRPAGDRQLVAPSESCDEQSDRRGDEERVIVLDKINDTHLTIRYFDEEKDGRLEKQYRCVRLTECAHRNYSCCDAVFLQCSRAYHLMRFRWV